MDYCNNNNNKEKQDNAYDIAQNKMREISHNQIAYTMYSIFHIIMALIAIYLSWKCNKGFDLSSFIIALIFPYLYLMYIFATNGTCGVLLSERKM